MKKNILAWLAFIPATFGLTFAIVVASVVSIRAGLEYGLPLGAVLAVIWLAYLNWANNNDLI